MKTNFKRFLSGILSAALVASALPVMASAAETNPNIAIDFTTFTKNATDKAWFDNQGSNSGYKIKVDCSNEQKSTIGNVNTDVYSDGKQAITYGNYSWLEFVPATNQTDNSRTDTLLDNAFTFETWIKIPSADNIGQGGEKMLLYSGNATTYNLKVMLPNVAVPIEGIEETVNKMAVSFERIFSENDKTPKKAMRTDAVIEYDKWNHIFVSYDSSLTTNEPVVVVNGEDISETLSSTVDYELGETAVARKGDAFEGWTKAGMGASGTNTIYKASWADLKLYTQKLTAEDAYNSYIASLASFEQNFNVGIYDSSNTLISGAALQNMTDEGNYVKFTPATGVTVADDNFLIYDKTADAALRFVGTADGADYILNGFTLTKDHEYELYIKDVKDADGNLVRQSEQVIAFKCGVSSEIAEPVMAIDFTGLTKAETEKKYFENKGSDKSYQIKIDCSADHKSTIENTQTGDYASDKKSLNYKNRTYFEIKTTDDVIVGDLLDDQFTFEAWVNVPSYNATYTKGNALLFSGAGVYNLKIDLPNAVVGETNKMQLRFDRSFVDGTAVKGRKKQTAAVLDYDTWNHIYVSYDPSSPDNLPIIVLNGEVQYLEDATGNALDMSENARVRTKADQTDSYTKIGAGNNYETALWQTSYADVKIYNTALPATVGVNSFNTSAADFEKNYNVGIYDAADTLVSGAALQSMTDAGNYIKFTPENGEIATAADFKLYDITAGENVALTSRASGTSLILDGFTLTKDHEYELTITGITDADGNPLRKSAQVIAFKCGASSAAPEPVISYDFTNRISSATSDAYLTNGAEGADTTKNVLYVNTSADHFRTVENIDSLALNPTATIEAMTAGWAPYWSIRDTTDNTTYTHSTTAMKILDGSFTFETWVKVPSAEDLKSSGNLLLYGSTSPYTYNVNLKIANDISTNLGVLDFEKVYTNGGYHFKTQPVFEYGKWNHIVISCNAEAEVGEAPIISVNGVGQTLIAISDKISDGQSVRTPRTYTGLTNPYVKFGQWRNLTEGIHHLGLADVKIYGQALTAEQVSAVYREAFSKVGNLINVQLLTEANIPAVIANETTVKAKIDLGADLSALPFAAIAVYNTDGKLLDVAAAVSYDGKEVITGTVDVAEGNTIKVITMQNRANLKPETKVAEFVKPVSTSAA